MGLANPPYVAYAFHMCVDLPSLIERLRGMTKRERDAIAIAASVGKSTVEKIAYGVIKNPSYSSVVRLSRELASHDAH